MRTTKDDGANVVMTALKVFLGLFLLSALLLIGVFGYSQIAGGPDTPEFEQVGELRYEVVNDWENPGSSDRYDRGEIESLVVEYTNEERTAEGLEPLNDSTRHLSEARNHSADMANNGYVGHVNSEGRNFRERIESRGCTEIGENAAATYYEVPVRNARTNETERLNDEDGIARMLVDDWMASPGHRENILDRDFDSVSVGAYVSKGNVVFATQVFCGVS